MRINRIKNSSRLDYIDILKFDIAFKILCDSDHLIKILFKIKYLKILI